MADNSQDQRLDRVDLNNSKLTQAQAGRDAIVDSQVTIHRSFFALYGNLTASPEVDWDWGMKLLRQEMQPEIKKRLKDTLLGGVLSEVDLSEEPEWVARLRPQSIALEAQTTLTTGDGKEEKIDPRQPILATFAREDIKGKLLILGTPGAGKTTLLLKLAEQLVDEALVNPKTVIPIIFELSTWREDQKSIEAWLIEQLDENFGGNRKRRIYEQWLEKQVLLPLLDGLDELGLARQQKCTEKINEFAKTYGQLVVCCRGKEFRQAGIKLSNLRGAVQLQPLSDGQMQDYLAQVKKAELWQQIQENPEMRRLLDPVLNPEDPEDEGEPGLLRVPLFIGLAAQIYDPTNPLKNKADLFERYIDRQLSLEVREADRRKELSHRQWAFKKLDQEPDWREVRGSLSWLAGQLQKRNQVELLIEKMQPSWLETKQNKALYHLITGLITELIIGLIFGLAAGLSVGPVWGLVAGLILGLIAGLIAGLSIRSETINPIESFQISLSEKLRQNIVDKLKRSLAFWLGSGLGSGLIAGLIAGLSVVLSVVLMAGLIVLISDLHQELKIREFPNQGTWNSLKNVILISALSYPISTFFVLSFELLSGVKMDIVVEKMTIQISAFTQHIFWISLISGIFCALFVGFSIGGGLPCIQHFCLRLILAFREHKIPWNYARFLNYCAERRLLQRIGGRYRFIHRELLDYFAQQAR